MLSGFCPTRFGVLFCSMVLGCRYTPWLLLDRVVNGACFLTGGMLDCDLSHRRSVEVLSMLYKIRCIRCTHFMVLYRYRMCQWGLHVVHWSHIGILMRLLAAEPYSTAGLLFPSQCLSGMILRILCSMLWDWRVSRAGSILFIGLTVLSLLCLLLFSLSLSF